MALAVPRNLFVGQSRSIERSFVSLLVDDVRGDEWKVPCRKVSRYRLILLFYLLPVDSGIFGWVVVSFFLSFFSFWKCTRRAVHKHESLNAKNVQKFPIDLIINRRLYLHAFDKVTKMIEDDVENSYRWVIDCLSTFIVLVRFRLSVTIVGKKKNKKESITLLQKTTNHSGKQLTITAL